MHTVEIDFDTYKEITRRRTSEEVTESDVIREALGLPSRHGSADVWESEGVRFPLGAVLEHKFRDGRLAKAVVRASGLEVEGTTYSGLSSAGTAVTGHNLNGWRFWFLRSSDGRLVLADTLRNK